MTEEKHAGSSTIPPEASFWHWESLSFLRAIGLLRLGYFGSVTIPIYAYFVQAWNSWAAAMQPPGVPLTLPGSLGLAFLGSVLLSAAQLLNEIFCPKIIKIYGTLRGYQGYLREHVTNDQAIAEAEFATKVRKLERKTLDRYPELADEDRKRLANEWAAVLLERDVARATEGDEASVMAYRRIWIRMNTAFWFARWTVVVCYLCAAAIAAVLIGWQVPFMFSLVRAALGL